MRFNIEDYLIEEEQMQRANEEDMFCQGVYNEDAGDRE